MASLIDRVGAFRAKITESGIATSKAGMPQFVARFHATQFYCEDEALFSHFGITEAAWVDWSAYDQDIIGYLQLIYEDKKNNGAATPMFFVEQLVEALGWDGQSFAALGSADWTGKEVTIWVEENEYNGNVSLRVEAIGKADASPQRGGVRAVDATELNALDAKFAMVLAGAAANAKAAAPKAVAAKAPAAAPAAAPKAAASPKPSAAAAPAAPKPAAASAPAAPAAAAPSAPASASVASSMTKDEAWAHVTSVSEGKTDDERADAWVKAGEEIFPSGEDNATGEQWAQLANRVCALLEIPF